MNIGIIGLGLIGGSFALSARKLIEDSVLYGEDKNDLHQKQALELKIVDQSLKPSNYYYMDVIILAIPVNAALDKVIPLLDQINDNTLLIDVGSTKSMICKKLELHPKRNQFLATHPIAGTEKSGPAAAISGLYVGKTNIICEVEKTTFKLQEKALQLFTDIGMRIRYMDAVSHDKHIAYVSHLSHISAFMLGKTVIDKEKNERDIFDMAGSGFASTVRLAKSSPAMWTPIFKQNKENVIETLEEFISNLQHFKELMQQDNFSEIYKEMENTNYIKQILNGIK